MLHDWHRRLMRNSDLPPEMIGTFRPALGWVGGTSPSDAAYVASLLDVSERTGRTALETLARHGVLSEIEAGTGTVGRARRWYAATELLRLWRA